MNNYIALTKILLKNSLTDISRNKKTKKSNNIKNIVLIVILIVSLLPLAGAIGAAVWAAYPIIKDIGQEGLIIGSGLMMISTVILFFGIFYIMNVFYFSKDTESLLPLPLRPSTIMAAKFTVTLFYEYLTELLFLAPVIVAFGIASNAGIVYYLYSVIGFLTLPIIPLVYAGIINILLMRFTNISRNRDQLRIIGGIAIMFLAIFINMKSQSFFGQFEDPEQIKAMLMQGNNSLLGMMSGLFPSNRFLAIALMNSSSMQGFINLFLFLGISILFLAAFLSMGEALYFKGLVGITETKSKRRKLTVEQFDKTMVSNPIIKAYVIKELKLLIRTPVYFINCVLMNFIWPLFLMIPFLTNSENGQGINELAQIAKTGSYDGMILAAAFGAIVFASGTNAIASTAISREGSNLFINKYLPISYHDQILAKVLSSVAFGIVAMLSMIAAIIYLVQPPVILILSILSAGFFGVLFTSLVGILIDLNFPKLHWDNEQKAVKQNMNVIIQMLISIAAAAAVVVPAMVLQLNVWVVLIGLILLFAFADAVLYGLMKSAGVSLYDKIDG